MKIESKRNFLDFSKKICYTHLSKNDKYYKRLLSDRVEIENIATNSKMNY